MTFLVNTSYRGQRITGQQRYAHEIAGRLCDHAEKCAAIGPTGRWARSSIRTWAWVQLVLPAVARSTPVLSLTARAPLWTRRQVTVVHDLFVLSHPEWFSRRYVWTHAPLLWAQIRTSSALVAVSQQVARELERLRGEPVAVAPNAPSDVFLDMADRPSDTGVLDRLGLESGTFFLAVGSRDPRKNLPRLAAAYALLDDDQRARHPLVVVGGHNAVFRGEEITWPVGTVDAGFVPDADLADLYRHARSVVFVSLAEGFGLPLVEAAAAGARSGLISNIEVFRWICGESARYVDPHDVGSIAAGLRAEIVRPGGLEIDLTRFRWDVSAAVIEETCQRVAARRDSVHARRPGRTTS